MLRRMNVRRYALAVAIVVLLCVLAAGTHAGRAFQIPAPGAPTPPAFSPPPPGPGAGKARADAISELPRGKNGKVSSQIDRLSAIDRLGRAGGHPLALADVALLPDDLRSAIQTGELYVDSAGRLQVFIQTNGDPSVVAPKIAVLGAEIQQTNSDAGVVQAMVPLSSLSDIAALDGVKYIRTPDRGHIQTGSVTTQATRY